MNNKCISEENIMAYLEGRLSNKNRSEVEAHISNCDRCLDLVAIASKLIDDPSFNELDTVPESVTNKAVKTIMGLKPPTLFDKAFTIINPAISKISQGLLLFSPFKAPAPVLVRGDNKFENNIVQINKSLANFEIKIEIEKTTQNTAAINVVLLKTNTSTIRVILLKNNREIASYILGEQGALFEDIQSGHYTLVIRRDGQIEWEYDFEIPQNDHSKK